jgi:Leucine-rich repeat (LRR) protein
MNIKINKCKHNLPCNDDQVVYNKDGEICCRPFSINEKKFLNALGDNLSKKEKIIIYYNLMLFISKDNYEVEVDYSSQLELFNKMITTFGFNLETEKFEKNVKLVIDKLNANFLIPVIEKIPTIIKINIMRLNTIYPIIHYLKFLPYLRSLDLSRNNLESLPEEIIQLSSLKGLKLNNNKLESLPESIGQLSSLQNLFLFNNNLKSLPESIGQLSSLQYLNVSNNKLESLPESIGQLSSLQYLNVMYNKLESLPESIGQLSSLQGLELNNNNLESLPESIGQLSSLKYLYLNNNKLIDLPELPSSIVDIELRENPISENPEDIPHLIEKNKDKWLKNPSIEKFLPNLYEYISSVNTCVNSDDVYGDQYNINFKLKKKLYEDENHNYIYVNHDGYCFRVGGENDELINYLRENRFKNENYNKKGSPLWENEDEFKIIMNIWIDEKYPIRELWEELFSDFSKLSENAKQMFKKLARSLWGIEWNNLYKLIAYDNQLNEDEIKIKKIVYDFIKSTYPQIVCKSNLATMYNMPDLTYDNCQNYTIDKLKEVAKDIKIDNYLNMSKNDLCTEINSYWNTECPENKIVDINEKTYEKLRREFNKLYNNYKNTISRLNSYSELNPPKMSELMHYFYEIVKQNAINNFIDNVEKLSENDKEIINRLKLGNDKFINLFEQMRKGQYCMMCIGSYICNLLRHTKYKCNETWIDPELNKLEYHVHKYNNENEIYNYHEIDNLLSAISI